MARSSDRRVGDLPDFVRPGDALVVNDTRVIAARLNGIRVRGESAAQIEATLIKRVDESRWRAFVRPAKKLRFGERIRFGETSESMACLLGALDAEVEAKGEGGEVLLAFAFHGAGARRGDRAARRNAAAALYRRAPRAGRRRSGPTTRRCSPHEPGAVAAPTAGLHFTPELVARDRGARARACTR